MIRRSFLLLFAFVRCIGLLAQEGETVKRVYTQRMAAFNRTLVQTNEISPVSSLMTYYQTGHDLMALNQLLHLIPEIEIDGKWTSISGAKDISVEDFPSGVKASFFVGKVAVSTTIMPLLQGGGSVNWEGAALYEIETYPTSAVRILLTEDKRDGRFQNYSAKKKVDTIPDIRQLKFQNSNTVSFRANEDNLLLQVKTSGKFRKGVAVDHVKKISIQFDSGAGNLIMAYADDASRLSRLGKLDPSKSRIAVMDYYTALLKGSYIETPDTNMNNAFRSAIYNLEYSWLPPMGWLECLHHWYGLWHMQASGGANWIGQDDRSRLSIMEHASNLIDVDSLVTLPNGMVAVRPFQSKKIIQNLKRGSVPQFLPNKNIHQEFGGSNQYWIWQIRKYIQFTADKELARQVLPYLDKVIAQILYEHDKDGNLLIDWGLQIGNQEDFIANPHDGSVPSMELINIFRTRAELSALLEDSSGATHWNGKAETVRKKLYHQLWMPSLGRFSFFEDPLEIQRLDGQYETFLYPVIYNFVDPLDQYTGLRHLNDHLLSKQGAVYASNNFSWHANGTWGMQLGEAAQPWAAWGYSKFGWNNMTWRPLKAMADWTMDINHRGSWPEISDEPSPAYFTPPASLYITATVEALFGVNINAPKELVTIAPSFPDHWKHARMVLPEASVAYFRESDKIEYSIETRRPLRKKLTWTLPPGSIVKCEVNGKPAEYTLKPGVGNMVLTIENIVDKKAVIRLEFKRSSYRVSYSPSLAEGDSLVLRSAGLTINAIDDRMHVLGAVKYSSHSVHSSINTGLLQPYQRFGRLGQMNFSRRTVFVHGRVDDGPEIWVPIDLTLLPKFEASFNGELVNQNGQFIASVIIRNNTDKSIKGISSLSFKDRLIPFDYEAGPRSEKKINISIPIEAVRDLAPGDNEFEISLPDHDRFSITLNAQKILKDRETKTLVQIPLPASDLISDTLWHELRIVPGFPHIFFTFSHYGWPQPMAALKDSTMINVAEIPGLSFNIPERHFIPVAHKTGQAAYKLDLPDGVYDKIYLLVIPFVDNHDMFTQVGRVCLIEKNNIVRSLDLNYPGNIDYWVPDVNPYSFATYRSPRQNRYGLLPMLAAGQSDWPAAHPPQFPQDEYWSTSIPVVTKSCLMNVIEVNLKEPTHLDHLIFESVGAYASFGIVGAAAHRTD